MLYAIIRSLQSVHNEYQFSLHYFIELFDEAVGGELPPEFLSADEDEGVSHGCSGVSSSTYTSALFLRYCGKPCILNLIELKKKLK
jgi:hypothetical protein